jgi:hypothetical protein
VVDIHVHQVAVRVPAIVRGHQCPLVPVREHVLEVRIVDRHQRALAAAAREQEHPRAGETSGMPTFARLIGERPV